MITQARQEKIAGWSILLVLKRFEVTVNLVKLGDQFKQDDCTTFFVSHANTYAKCYLEPLMVLDAILFYFSAGWLWQIWLYLLDQCLVTFPSENHCKSGRF